MPFRCFPSSPPAFAKERPGKQRAKRTQPPACHHPFLTATREVARLTRGSYQWMIRVMQQVQKNLEQIIIQLASMKYVASVRRFPKKPDDKRK
jgi:hypothetical protein